MNNNQLKQVPVDVNLDAECYEQCTQCLNENHIGRLNIITGRCHLCSEPRKRLDKNLVDELLGLDKGLR